MTRAFAAVLPVLVAAALLVAGASACSDADPPAAVTTIPPPPNLGPGQDASTNAADGGDAAAADGAVPTCAAPALGGATVPARLIAGAPPADTGGAVADGMYDLTGFEIYAGLGEEGDPDGGLDGGALETARATLVISAGAFAITHTSASVEGSVTTASSGKQRIDDVFLVIDETCPTDASKQTPFTATGASLRLHTAQTRFETYTRR